MEELKTSGIEEYVIEFLDLGSWYRICISTQHRTAASAGNREGRVKIKKR